jgi:signal transduction histidine kinase
MDASGGGVNIERMRERGDRLASEFLSGIDGSLQRIAAHPLVADTTLLLGTAALSIFGLKTQDRLGPHTLIFCVALCAPLPLRRRSPRLCFAIVALVAFVQWLTTPPQLADAAVLIALYQVALDAELAAIALASAIAETGAIMAAIRWSPSAPLKICVGLSGLAFAAAVSGITVRQRRALLQSLEEKAARLESERDQEGRLAAARERARIAREMHDIVAHNLSVMIALADGAAFTIDSAPLQAKGAVERVSGTGRQALVEMRRLLGVLRDGDGAHDKPSPREPQPTLERLDDLLSQVHAAGIPVTMQLEGDPRSLPEGVQLTVFRVAQEALTNTLKHARRPTSAHLALSCRPDRVELEVTDRSEQGTTAASPEPTLGQAGDGRGLRGMRERAAAYGGQLEAGPDAGGDGWRVHLDLRSAPA